MGKKRKEFLVKLISVLVLTAGALVVLVPFIWMFSTSFKTLSDVFQYPPKFFGEIFYWQNYVNVFETIDFIGMFKNTLIVTVAVAAGQLVVYVSEFQRKRHYFQNLSFCGDGALLCDADSDFFTDAGSEADQYIMVADSALCGISFWNLYDASELSEHPKISGRSGSHRRVFAVENFYQDLPSAFETGDDNTGDFYVYEYLE